MYESILKLAELQDDGELSPATEEAIALAYADRHRLELRYVAAWSRWLSYDGASWKLDDTLHAVHSLPPPQYNDDGWRIVEALLDVLHRAPQ